MYMYIYCMLYCMFAQPDSEQLVVLALLPYCVGLTNVRLMYIIL